MRARSQRDKSQRNAPLNEEGVDRCLPPSLPSPQNPQHRKIPTQRVSGSRAGHDGRIHRADGRQQNQQADDSAGGRAQQASHHVRHHRFGGNHAGQAQAV